MINSVCLTGHVASEIEGRVTSTGKNVSTFRIAVQKQFKPSDGSSEADFFNVCCWGKTAEFCDKHLSKGRLIGIEGRLQSRSYTASDNSRRDVVEIVASQISPLDRPKEASDQTELQEVDPFEGL